MKSKILLLTALACFIGTANAGYSMKIPLETSAGGVLPDNSINISFSNNDSGSGNGSGDENEGGEDSGNQTPPDGQANCDANAANVRAMYTFLGMGTLTSHSFVNEVCIMNIHATNRNSNPEGSACTDNGDGTGTYETSTASNYEGSGIRTMVERITFNGSCIYY